MMASPAAVIEVKRSGQPSNSTLVTVIKGSVPEGQLEEWMGPGSQKL